MYVKASSSSSRALDARENDGKDIPLYRSTQDAIPRAVSFYSILGKEPEEPYQCWALIATVMSLLALISEKLVQLALWAF